MRALLCEKIGSIDDLVIREVDPPRAGPGQVVIDVKAAGVNFPDVLITQGLYQLKPPLPFSPGGESAGVVSEVGEGVTELALGDRVMAFFGVGGFVEKIALSPQHCVRMPDAMSFEEGGSLLLASSTSHHALVDRARLAKGETVLVLGAAGGVGIAAVQIAKAYGARVIAAASSEAKRAFCRAHGADVVIDPAAGDPRQIFKSLGRIDVVLDPVGGELSEPALRALSPRGRFLVIGFASGTIPKLPLNLPLLKEVDVIGVQWGVFAMRERERQREIERDLVRLVAEGAVRPPIHARYPLERAVDALRSMSSREILGKVVVVP